jgi:hypothetical protein
VKFPDAAKSGKPDNRYQVVTYILRQRRAAHSPIVYLDPQQKYLWNV